MAYKERQDRAFSASKGHCLQASTWTSQIPIFNGPEPQNDGYIGYYYGYLGGWGIKKIFLRTLMMAVGSLLGGWCGVTKIPFLMYAGVSQIDGTFRDARH